MIQTFKDMISAEEHSRILEQVEEIDFIDGQATAGWAAREVKNNEQAPGDSPQRKAIAEIVLGALRRHQGFRQAILPKQMHSLLVSRYVPGMEYGRHVDNPMMGGNVVWRSDVSFTLFLNDPDDYGGGELCIESGSGEMRFKLAARSMIAYPSTSIHRILPVISGERRVVVAWIQSQVRDAGQREMLSDLARAKRLIFDKEGKSRAFDLVSKSHANLVRRWADP
jgi:PKHD-type hydroxylase